LILALIILCGLPFSGKSTIAKKLGDELGLRVLSYDHDIYAHHKKEVPPGVSAAKEYYFVQSIARDQLQALLESGQSIIYDDLCLEKSDRHILVELAKMYGAQPIIVFVDTSLTIIEQRRKDNLQSNGRDHIDDAKCSSIFLCCNHQTREKA
jgi:predicted kinase